MELVSDPKLPQPHDGLFKYTFARVENAAGEFREVLPPLLVRRIDWSTLALRPGSFIDDELRQHHTDLLYSATLDGDRHVLLYVLFEHPSSPERFMPLRMLRYLVRIWTDWLREAGAAAQRLPMVVPVVLYNGAEPWVEATSMQELYDVDDELLAALQPHVVSFEFLLDDLPTHEDHGLVGRITMTALSRLVLLCLKHARDNRHLRDLLLGWLSELHEMFGGKDVSEAVHAVSRYILEVSDHIDTRELADIFERAGGARAKEAVMTAGQQLIEQGRKEGRKEGREEGREEGVAEGERRVVRRVLEARFGPLPSEAQAKLECATGAQLERWSERLLTAATIDDVFTE